MRSADSSSPQVRVLAEHISDHLSVFVVAENTDAERPANGGLRLLSYDSDATCKADGHRLASLMTNKHSLYGTGFAGGKVVARAANPAAVKDELINVTAELLESLGGAMITGCDLNTSLEDMERLTALTPHVLAAVGSPVDASSATAYRHDRRGGSRAAGQLGSGARRSGLGAWLRRRGRTGGPGPDR